MIKASPTGDVVFGKNTVKSTTSIIEIKKAGETEPAFRQEDAEIAIDFKSRTADYKAVAKYVWA